MPVMPGLGGAVPVWPRMNGYLAEVSDRQVRVTAMVAGSIWRSTISTSWPFRPYSGSLTVMQSPGL